MRTAIVALSSLLIIGATEPDQPQALNQPAYQEPAIEWKTLEDVIPPSEAECRDRIQKIRKETGQPALDSPPASVERPQLLYAVHREEDGCSMMVMKGDIEDVRPLPKTKERDGHEMLIPAN